MFLDSKVRFCRRCGATLPEVTRAGRPLKWCDGCRPKHGTTRAQQRARVAAEERARVAGIHVDALLIRERRERALRVRAECAALAPRSAPITIPTVKYDMPAIRAGIRTQLAASIAEKRAKRDARRGILPHPSPRG